MSNKYGTPSGPSPQYPDPVHTQQRYDAGPTHAGALGPVAQEPYYQYPPQGAQADYYGQQPYPPYGPPPQGYYGYPNQTQGMHYQQPYGPPPEGHFTDGRDRGLGGGALGGGLCAALLAAMACCCCLDFMF